MNTHVSVDYTTLETKACSNGRYGRYDTLNQAKKACSADSHCSGVYDPYGDGGKHGFNLCPKGIDFEDVSWDSIIFQKGMLTPIKLSIFVLVVLIDLVHNSY